MNSFKLQLLTIKHIAINNYDYVSKTKFQTSTISEFYEQKPSSQEIINSLNTYCYSYDEKFSKHKNGQKELSFKMDRYITRIDTIEENPFTQNIVVGSQLLLIDDRNRHHLFTVNKVSYTFNDVNIIYQYTCADSFTYQLGRQNDGYIIENDISSNDFLGSHTIDWWVKEIIAKDCYISYDYLGLSEKLVVGGELIKRPIDPNSAYNNTVVFSGSGTAQSLLISLGSNNGLMLNTYEHLDQEGNLTALFWFEPEKHTEVSGLKYSPYSDISNFSLTHNGTSLSTVLNVQTHTINDNYISLLPSVTPFFSQYFLSDEWRNSNYYAGMFTSAANGITYHYKLNSDLILPSLSVSGGYDVYDLGVININWYKQFKFSSIDGQNSYITYGNNTQSSETWVLEIDGVIYKPDEWIQPGSSQSLYLLIPSVGALTSYNIYITFYREPTPEDLEFAAIADQCPWLENKLIDFSYFINHNILTSAESKELNKTINQELRITNGQLLVYAQSYYAALHQKTKLLSELINALDMIGATFQSDFIQPFTTNGYIADTTNFLKNYNYITNLYDKVNQNQFINLLNKPEVISEYVNNYCNHEQQFLKNVYQFKKYFEEPVSFNIENSIYTYEIEIINPNYLIGGLSSPQLLLDKEDSWYDTITYQFLIQPYESSNDVMLPVSRNRLIDATNYKTAYYDTELNPVKPNIGDLYSKNNKYYRAYIICKGTYSGSTMMGNFTYDSRTFTYKLKKLTSQQVECEVHYYTQWYKDADIDTNFSNLKTAIVNATGISVYSSSWKIKYEQISEDDIIKNNYYHGLPYISNNAVIREGDKYYPIWNNNSCKWIQSNEINSYFNSDWYKYLANYKQQGNLGDDKEFDYYSANFKNKDIYYKDTNDNNKYLLSTLVTWDNVDTFYRRVDSTMGWIAGSVAATSLSLGGLALVAMIKWITHIHADRRTNFALGGDCHNDVFYNDLSSHFWTEFPFSSAYANSDKHIYFTKAEGAYSEWLEQYNSQGSDAYDTILDYFRFLYGNVVVSNGLYAKSGDNNLSQYKDFYYQTTWYRVVTNTDAYEPGATYKIVYKNDIFDSNWSLDINNKGIYKVNNYYYLDSTIYYPIESVAYPIDTSNIDWDSSNNTNTTLFNYLHHEDDQVLYNNYLWQLSGSESDQCFILKEENFQIRKPTNDDDLYGKTLFNVITNIVFDLTTINSLEWDGIYQSEGDGKQSAASLTVFDPDLSYYIQQDNKYIKAYTYKNAGELYYYNNTHYVYEDFINYWNGGILKLPLAKVTLDNNQTTIGQTVWTDCQLIGGPVDDHFIGELYIGDDYIGLVQGVQISLEEYTNGNFWVRYHTPTQSTASIITEQACLIETTLTQYWEQAYAASVYCNFFLPETWLPYNGNQTNKFYGSIIAVLGMDNAKPTYGVSNHFIPLVKQLDKGSKYKFQYFDGNDNNLIESINHLTNQKLSYNDIQQVSVIDNNAIHQMFKDLNLDESNWYAIIQYDNYKYYEYVNGGMTWQQALQAFSRGTISADYFQGWDQMMVNVLNTPYYQDYKPEKYYEYKQKHLDIWRSLYLKYPSVILEKSFTFEDATTSQELLDAAKIAFNEYTTLERQYNISIIKYNKLKGFAKQPLDIGDAIELQADEIYQGRDDISQSLTQFLFITDISYDLRNPTNATITVNTIKYTDKVIKELLKLIR